MIAVPHMTIFFPMHHQCSTSYGTEQTIWDIHMHVSVDSKHISKEGISKNSDSGTSK